MQNTGKGRAGPAGPLENKDQLDRKVQLIETVRTMTERKWR